MKNNWFYLTAAEQWCVEERRRIFAPCRSDTAPCIHL